MDCKFAIQAITDQIVGVLERMEAEEYAKPLDIYNGSSLGQHFRHIFDFYDCLLRGITTDSVDYANRKRNPIIENDPKAAKEMFTGILDQIKGLDETLSLSVRADFLAGEQSIRPKLDSSVGRELMFTYDHAIHHLAIIKIGLQTAFPHIELDEDFGVAPSTIKHRSGHPAGDR